MSNDREVEIIIENEKSAKDFVRSKRAISFLIWMVVSFGLVPLAKLAMPELELDVSLIINKSTMVVIYLMTFYTGQDALVILSDIVAMIFTNQMDDKIED